MWQVLLYTALCMSNMWIGFGFSHRRRGRGGPGPPDFFVWGGPIWPCPHFWKMPPHLWVKSNALFSELISRRQSRQMYRQSEQWKLKTIPISILYRQWSNCGVFGGERRAPSLYDRCGWTQKTAFNLSMTATYNTSNEKNVR